MNYISVVEQEAVIPYEGMTRYVQRQHVFDPPLEVEDWDDMDEVVDISLFKAALMRAVEDSGH